MKKAALMTIVIIAAIVISAPAFSMTQSAEKCVSCHKKVTPVVVNQWEDSKHSGAGIGCFSCHEAAKGDPSGREHHGFKMTPVVTPNHCDPCHADAVKEFKESLHDESGFFSLSAYGVVAGEEVEDGITTGQTKNYKTNFSREGAEAGCLDCHGTVIKVGRDGELINWPNVGMGRFNPDGSVGSCSTCHTRHDYSIAQARKPETCGQCHLGPDHPQREIYEESKHGNLVAAMGEEYDWEAEDWGPDHIGAPTCATCHMSGFGATKTTHNVSARLKWELEPAFSWPTDREYLSGEKKYPIKKSIAERYEKIHGLPPGSLTEVGTGAPNPFATAKKFAPEVYEAYVGKGKWWSKGETRADAVTGEAGVSSEKKREEMLKICTQCHSRRWAEGDLKKADATIDTYNAVALAIKKKYYDPIKDEKLDEDVKFNGQSRADTLWHEVWHHEGRIWRMGAFMQGQDWQHWEGSYEVADDGTEFADLLMKLRLRKQLMESMSK